MTRTFLLALDLDDDVDLTAIADDIQFILQDEYTVSSVKPWSSPLALPQPQPDTLQPFSL